jgi:hypothetical protein
VPLLSNNPVLDWIIHLFLAERQGGLKTTTPANIFGCNFFEKDTLKKGG